MLMFALAAAALMTAAQPASPPADRDQDQFRAIMRAVHSDGRLWLLTDDGKMVTIADQGDAPSPVSLPEPARDLCLWRGSPLIVTRNRDSTELTARRYDGGRWKWLASVPIEEEGLVALNCSDQRVTLITSDRLVELQGGSTREIPLSDRLGRGRVTSTGLAVDGHLYVGLNAGEWGGGLKRIDRSSGKVETV